MGAFSLKHCLVESRFARLHHIRRGPVGNGLAGAVQMAHDDFEFFVLLSFHVKHDVNQDE